MKRLLFLALTLALVLGAMPVLTSSHAQEIPKRVLVRGSPFHGANGIMFGPDGNLYIASVVGREIVVMDPETGEILDRLGPDQGVETPDDLAFGPDGSLYWTAFFIGEVGRMSPDGEKSTAAQLPPGVNPITFSDDGRLFVALCFVGDALYEVDPEGVEEPRLITDALGPGCGLNGMDWGPDGFLYGPRWFQGEVVRVDVDTGEFTTVANGIGAPAAVKFDSQGRLHVLDTMRGQVLRVDIETGDKEVIATIMPGLDNLAFDSQDRLYVSSFTEGYIVEVLEDGTTRLVSASGMIVPGGVAVLGESVFVADVLSLKEFDGLTGEQQSIERDILGFSALGAPFTVSPDGDNLLVSSWFNNAVRVWNPETREVLEEHLDFAVPLNAIRFQGDLVVAELGTGSVVRANAADPAERVTLADGLFVPAGLAATDDDLWVGDWATGVVWQIVADGEPLAEPIPVGTGLSFPEGLAVDLDGGLLVVESGAGRLSRIDTATGEVSTVAEGLELGAQGPPGAAPPTWIFNGVAVGPSGAIYVTGDVGNVLYRLSPPIQAVIPAGANASGYVDSRDRLDAYFGSGYLWTGQDTRPKTPRYLHGVFQVDLASVLPEGAVIVEARVELTGRSTRYLSPELPAEFTLNLLPSSFDADWMSTNYYYVHHATPDVTLMMDDPDPAVAGVNTFTFSAEGLAALQARLEGTGRASFRADGEILAPYGRHIMGWDGRVSVPPVLVVTYYVP